jgi:hypothetical protein
MNNDQWEEVSSRVRVILDYGVVKKEWLESNRMAKFIAAVPFLAGCRKAMETSFVHLLTYLAALDESVKDFFMHGPEDDSDVYSRLTSLLMFPGGDDRVLSCYRDLLALCMVSNYRKDAEADRLVGKYNPVGEGVWDGEKLTMNLLESIQGTISPEISGYYTVEDALKGYWQG